MWETSGKSQTLSSKHTTWGCGHSRIWSPVQRDYSYTLPPYRSPII